MAKLKEVIEGDFRIDGFEDEVQTWLRKIKPLAKRTPVNEKVKIDDIESLIHKICKKYQYKIQWINLTIIKDEIPWYSVSIVDEKTHEWKKTLYGITIYELFSKVALYLYAATRESE